MSWPAPLAVFTAADAAVIAAFSTIAVAIVGPVVALLVSSLRRIRSAAEAAAHNTQTTTPPSGTTPAAGVPVQRGDPQGPSPYDVLLGRLEQVSNEIGRATEAAHLARHAAARSLEAVRSNDDKTAVLSERVETAFVAAKKEREEIRGKLNENIARLQESVANGQEFARLITTGTLPILQRLDALDGGSSAGELTARLRSAGILPPAPPEEETP